MTGSHFQPPKVPSHDALGHIRVYQAIVRDPANFPELYRKMPNHTTCVERKIKLVTFIARNYEVDHPSDRFEQEMSNAIFSQQIMPQFENKDDYISHHLSTNQEDEEDIS